VLESGNFFDIFNAPETSQETCVLHLQKSVTYIIPKKKRIDFMSNMKKCTIS